MKEMNGNFKLIKVMLHKSAPALTACAILVGLASGSYFILKPHQATSPQQASSERTKFDSKASDANSVSQTSQQPVDSAASSAPDAQSTSTSTPTYKPWTCKNIPIPRQVEYKNDDSMAIGQTRVGYTGQDGYVISCTVDSNGHTSPTNGMRVNPVDDIVYKGTGLDAQRQQQADQEKTARDQRYNLNLAQCIQSLEAQGVSSSTASSMCRSSVQY